MCSRIGPISSGLLPRFPNWSRRSTRSRNGASLGAPVSRDPSWWAVTSCTTIRGSPSSAPASTVWKESSSDSSLRQLTGSVCFVVADSAARRYVVTSPPRNA